MMEFPLFPVFIRAAVQTPPVPWGWAGLGKSAPVYPSSTWLPLRESRALRHIACWSSIGRRATVCSALLHVLSHAYSLSSLSVRNKCTLGFSQMTGPINITRTVDPTLVSGEASTGVVWQHTGGQFSACSACLFMSPTSWVFLYLDLLLSTSLRQVLLLIFSTGIKIKIYLWFSCHVQNCTSQPKKTPSLLYVLRFEGPLKFTTSHISQLHSQLLGFSPQWWFCSNCSLTSPIRGRKRGKLSGAHGDQQ